MKKRILFAISCLFFTICTQAQSVTGVSLDTTNLTLGISETYQLTQTITPNNATNKTVTWTTSDVNIATISNGLITAINVGTATVIVTTKDGNFKDTCVVTVTTIPVTSVSLNKKTLHLECGDCYQLITTIKPTNATDKAYSFTSENPYVASVSSKGLISTGDPDTTLVIIETNDGNFKDTCVVVVTEPLTAPVKEVQLDRDSVTLTKGDTLRLSETVLPYHATNKKVTWHSENDLTASVSAGLVTANTIGKTSIYVRTVDGGITDSCFITILEKEFINVESETITNSNGLIDFSIKATDQLILTGSFMIELPEGIILDDSTTRFANEFASNLPLTITNKGNNNWFIQINENIPTLSSDTLQKIMNIGIKTNKSITSGNYNSTFTHIKIKLNDGSELNKERLDLKMKVKTDDVANEPIKKENTYAYITDNRLHVQSPQTETIYIYSLNGTLLYTKKKATGDTVFDINTQEPILIIKGSTGWTQKVAKSL